MNLIEVRNAKKVIFIGDIHGDLEVSQKVIKDYLPVKLGSAEWQKITWGDFLIKKENILASIFIILLRVVPNRD